MDNWNMWDMLITHYVREGYRLDLNRPLDYASLYLSFDIDLPVLGGDQLEIGEKIEITMEGITRTSMFKRGYLWASSAEITSRKGNVYSYGDSTVIPSLTPLLIPPYSRQSGEITDITTNL